MVALEEETRKGMWVIGYGSLIFKPIPKYYLRVEGYIEGYIRRFWQSSSDHRGTPESPGRVVTLVPFAELQKDKLLLRDAFMYELSKFKREEENDEVHEDMIEDLIKLVKPEDLKVWGCAYYVLPKDVDEMREYLDEREQDGYTSHNIPFKISNVPNDLVSQLGLLDDLQKDSDGNYFLESTIYIGTKDNPSFVGPEKIEKTAKIIRDGTGPSGKNTEYLIELWDHLNQLKQEGSNICTYLDHLVSIVHG